MKKKIVFVLIILILIVAVGYLFSLATLNNTESRVNSDTTVTAIPYLHRFTEIKSTGRNFDIRNNQEVVNKKDMLLCEVVSIVSVKEGFIVPLTNITYVTTQYEEFGNGCQSL